MVEDLSPAEKTLVLAFLRLKQNEGSCEVKIVWLWPGFCFGSKQQVIIMCYVLRFFIFLQVSMSGVKSELFVMIFATYHEIWISYNGFYIHIHVAMASAFV
ncbi:hypothetical protein PVK06_011104 [Gossypium arboreum]|uniref:Uncharacterized protein n=1 Tax=Gossypium arboreum TaxID=29729 RepID=A0ABR0Q8V2_GOSAR|nr:hypothetical protein PVK06_011104 [Gossypium arboreum]